MIDSIAVAPNVHMMTGSLVLVMAVAFLAMTGWAWWKKLAWHRGLSIVLIGFQLSVMLQVLVGIKLLDQGSGPLQLFIHYLGGLAPLGFCLLLYWLPSTSDSKKVRRALIASIASLIFVVLTFAVGSMYVPGA